MTDLGISAKNAERDSEAMILGKKIVIDKVSEMHGLGTPDDLKNFITKKNLTN